MLRRELILATASDLAVDFLEYDRKDDEKLPRGSVEAAIRAGEITIEEIIERFSEQLRWRLGED